MREILLLIAAVWGVSGAITVVMFSLDERAYRRTSRAMPQRAEDVLVPAASMPRTVQNYGNGALA